MSEIVEPEGRDCAHGRRVSLSDGAEVLVDGGVRADTELSSETANPDRCNMNNLRTCCAKSEATHLNVPKESGIERLVRALLQSAAQPTALKCGLFPAGERCCDASHHIACAHDGLRRGQPPLTGDHSFVVR